VTHRDRPRKLALGISLSLLFAMLAFVLFAGRPNQGLLAMSAAARLIFCMGAAAGVVASSYVLRPSGSMHVRGQGRSQRALHFLLAWLTWSVFWSLACYGLVHRVALLLDGPVSNESARLQRPLSPGPPLWCSYYTTVHTESGYTGSLCMERVSGRAELVPLLGCVLLDAPATLQVTRTFLGPVGSLLEVVDVGGHCAKQGSKR
jgi:hypothetical protein